MVKDHIRRKGKKAKIVHICPFCWNELEKYQWLDRLNRAVRTCKTCKCAISLGNQIIRGDNDNDEFEHLKREKFNYY